MTAVYEVWDVSTGNLVGAYGTEREALAIVRRTVERYGRSSADSLALARDDEDGQTEALAQGGSLAALAELDGRGERHATG